MKNTNILEGSVVYLAGAMEMVPDGGVSYREAFKAKARDAGLKFKFLDPTKKITGLTPDVDKEKNRINKYKTEKNWPALRRLMKQIVKQDLRQVDLCDFVVVFIDRNVPTFGTLHELFVSEMERKLALIVPIGGKESCPAWIFGIIHHDFIFETADDAIEYLVKTNSGEISLNSKLILFRRELEALKE